MFMREKFPHFFWTKIDLTKLEDTILVLGLEHTHRIEIRAAGVAFGEEWLRKKVAVAHRTVQVSFLICDLVPVGAGVHVVGDSLVWTTRNLKSLAVTVGTLENPFLDLHFSIVLAILSKLERFFLLRHCKGGGVGTDWKQSLGVMTCAISVTAVITFTTEFSSVTVKV